GTRRTPGKTVRYHRANFSLDGHLAPRKTGCRCRIHDFEEEVPQTTTKHRLFRLPPSTMVANLAWHSRDVAGGPVAPAPAMVARQDCWPAGLAAGEKPAPYCRSEYSPVFPGAEPAATGRAGSQCLYCQRDWLAGTGHRLVS